MVNFLQQHITLGTDGGTRRVSIAGDALQFWWGADVGPQTAEGLIAEHIEEIEAIVADKIGRGAIEDDGSIVITEEDLE